MVLSRLSPLNTVFTDCGVWLKAPESALRACASWAVSMLRRP